jgi:hypothetical protein
MSWEEGFKECCLFTDGFVPALLTAQLVDAITWWPEQGRPYTPGQIATYWYRLLCSMLREVSMWEWTADSRAHRQGILAQPRF